jgi:hypothetical protein
LWLARRLYILCFTVSHNGIVILMPIYAIRYNAIKLLRHGERHSGIPHVLSLAFLSPLVLFNKKVMRTLFEMARRMGHLRGSGDGDDPCRQKNNRTTDVWRPVVPMPEKTERHDLHS